MEIREKLRVTAEEFFSQMMVSVLYDIKSATGRDVKREQIHKGYHYTKKMKNKVGREGDVRITVTEYDPPYRYSASFDSASGINRIEYRLEEAPESGIEVFYLEDYEGDTKSQDLNYRIIGALYRRSAKKRTKKMFHAMEDYIIKNRDQAEADGTGRKTHGTNWYFNLSGAYDAGAGPGVYGDGGKVRVQQDIFLFVERYKKPGGNR